MGSRPLYKVCTFSTLPQELCVPEQIDASTGKPTQYEPQFGPVANNESGKSPFKMDERQPGSCEIRYYAPSLTGTRTLYSLGTPTRYLALEMLKSFSKFKN